MEILIIESDKVIRDQIKVGLQNFRPFSVDCAEGFAGVSRARVKEYDYILVGVNDQGEDGIELLRSLREFNKDTDLVVVTSQKQIKQMSGEKTRLNLYAFIAVPIDVRQFFRVVARFKTRDREPTAPKAGNGG